MGAVTDTCRRRGARLLLLFELLLVRVSADCQRPETPDEMELTEETLLMSSFPEGVSVVLVCYEGFIKTSGTGVVTCTGGKWTQPDLICSRMDCGAPPAQPNMEFDLSGGTKLGDTIKVTCAEGYQISGSSYKQCFSNGWLGRSKCKVKDCRRPKEQPNMTMSDFNNTLYGAEIEVSCKEGFRLIGSRIRRCEIRGWSGDPHCEPVTCDAIRALAFGRSSWDSRSDSPTVGQTINFACEEGLVLVGASAIVCQENGTYDNQPPVCLSATTKGRFEASSMTSMTSMTTMTSMTSMTTMPSMNSMTSTSMPPNPVSESTVRPAATSAAPDVLASTSGDGPTASTKDNDQQTSTVFFMTPMPKVFTSNAFIRKQGHIVIIVALASVALVVFLVCAATRNVQRSRRTGFSGVPRLISEESGAQEESASQL